VCRRREQPSYLVQHRFERRLDEDGIGAGSACAFHDSGTGDRCHDENRHRSGQDIAAEPFAQRESVEYRKTRFGHHQRGRMHQRFEERVSTVRRFDDITFGEL
jgi:hypothetical protein